MRIITLGKSGIRVTKTAFGALPIQRRTMDDAILILRAAYDKGITLYDTARGYTDSEEKLGRALSDVREHIVLATKTHAPDADGMARHLEESLSALKTDVIDIYQFHNPADVPLADDPRYRAMEDFKRQGMIRHIGITTHSADRAVLAARSGLYETVQYPISCISDPRDLEVVETCRDLGVGVLGMKALAGGLISDARLSFAALDPYDHLAPLWGVQHMHELNQLVALDNDPPALDDAMRARIAALREELGGEFCRGCGYCMPHCPRGIAISMCARMTLLLGRAVWQSFMTDEWNRNMEHIESCLHCGACTEHCPYGLDIPALLEKNLAEYRRFRAEHGCGAGQ